MILDGLASIENVRRKKFNASIEGMYQTRTLNKLVKPVFLSNEKIPEAFHDQSALLTENLQ